MTIEELSGQLIDAEKSGDLGALCDVRMQICREHPDSDEAIESRYKLGLNALFNQRHLEAATEHFQAAAKSRKCYWSAAARTSLGICLYHRGKRQKALFELRKIAHRDPPDEHSVAALSFIETIFANDGDSKEASRTRAQRIAQLEELVAGNRENTPTARLGHYLFNLCVALRDAGQQEKADNALSEAKAIGPKILGEELYRTIAGTD